MASPAAPQAPEEPTRDRTASADIVADDNPYSGEDPAFLTDSDVASSTQSLSSSVLNYQYENGRRYHAYRSGEYVLPNDDREQERLDLHHHIFRLVVGGDLFRAPIDPTSARILDLGTGTGIWAIEMGDEYPKADITGTDLSPIQPGWVPPNCFFEVDDFESPWEFSKPFDFIHGRNLAGAVGDWPRLYQRIKDNLSPGGWVEMVDFDGERIFSDDHTGDNAPNVRDCMQFINEASHSFGKDIDVAKHHKKRLIDAGFKNVREEVYKVPINPWARDRRLKEIGRFQQVNMVESVESYCLALFTRVLGWSMEEFHVFAAAVRRELEDRSIHLYTKFYYVYGQKDDE